MTKTFFKCVVLLTLISLGFSCHQSNLTSIDSTIDNDKQSRSLCSENSIDCPIKDRDFTNTNLLSVLPNGLYKSIWGTMYNNSYRIIMYDNDRLCIKTVDSPTRGSPTRENKVYVMVSSVSQAGGKMYVNLYNENEQLSIVDFHIKRPTSLGSSPAFSHTGKTLWSYSGNNEQAEEDADLIDCISSKGIRYTKVVEYEYDDGFRKFD